MNAMICKSFKTYIGFKIVQRHIKIMKLRNVIIFENYLIILTATHLNEGWDRSN